MAITDSQKVDYLFKKIGYSVSKTDTSTVKSPSNESIASPLVIRGDSIWAQSDLIGNVIPGANTAIVTVYADALSSTIEAVNDGTASANRTWKTNLTDWIDPSFGATYQVKVYIANAGNTAPQTYGTQLFADGSGSNDEWFFDYSSGVLNFIGTSLPSVSFTGKSIFVSGARYTGEKGLDTLSNLTVTGNISASYIAGTLTTNTQPFISNIGSGGNITFNNSRLVNLLDPLATQDAVTVNYLNTRLANVAGSLTALDTSIIIYDAPATAGNIEITLDGNLVGKITAGTTEFYNTVGIGNFTIANESITNTGNINLDAGSGVVRVLGSDAIRIPAGDDVDRPAYPEVGYFRFNTSQNNIEYWDGSDWIVPGQATITSDLIQGDGVNDSFTLSQENTADGVIVSINGTVQQPAGVFGPGAYQVSGNVITFSEIPADSDIIEIRHIKAGVVSVDDLTFGNTTVFVDGANVNISGNLIPIYDKIYDIGAGDANWHDLHLSGNANVYLNGARITTTALGNLTYTSNLGVTTDLTGGVIPITRGGTGANTAVKALENLLPNSASSSGYVLTANGDGTFYWEIPQAGPEGTFQTTYETLNRNLSAYDYVINRTGSVITSIVYTLPSTETITKEFTYNGSLIESMAIYGVPLGSTVYTKNLAYSGSFVSGASYSIL